MDLTSTQQEMLLYINYYEANFEMKSNKLGQMLISIFLEKSSICMLSHKEIVYVLGFLISIGSSYALSYSVL